MSAELHESHRWGEKPFFDGEQVYAIPVCLDCRAEGFENEPDGFLPCPGPSEEQIAKEKKSKVRTSCSATLKSRDTPGHTHVCLGGHADGDHYCAECRRWFGVKR